MDRLPIERFYWRVTLLFLVASPVWIFLALSQGLAFRCWRPYGLVLLLFTFPVIWGVELLRTIGSPQRRVWVRHPSVHRDEAASEDLNAWWAGFMARANQLGFQCTSGEADNTWHLVKTQAEKVTSFADHAFEASVVLTSELSGARVAIDLTMRDILIIETGEFQQLARMAGYLLGAEPEPAAPTLPFVLNCSAVLAWMAHVFGYIEFFGLYRSGLPVLEACGMSLSLTAWAMVSILQRPKEIYGMRLAVTALALAAIPCGCLLVQGVLKALG